ncbi:hypothetical protein ARAM_005608 [Aspergillus rambellii]|uniref:Glycosyltransferase 2-like domain-containing protein n=1 Tax=Aspergillus rambellii TaxID=308745 RepID=A0A0F8USX5_9EURO|nr:hypothetical protein ARAM_005608 [Aspergillus rambellii]
MIASWASRCLPGFSIIALLALVVFSATDAFPFPWSSDPPEPGRPGEPPVLNLAQTIFVIYTVLVHLNTLAFTGRLSWALVHIHRQTNNVLKRRTNQPREASSPRSSGASIASDTSSLDDVSLLPYAESQPILNDKDIEEEVVHAIIIPNYNEEIHTLRSTLDVLASHPRASSQYEIYLAMEQKESGAPEKVEKLMSSYGMSFSLLQATFHPAGLPSEIAGKSSNVAFAARHIGHLHRAELNSGYCNVIVTVMDADTNLWPDYFTEIRRLHLTHVTDADRTLYSCPIIFDRNSTDSPILVRCADLLWGFAGLSTMHPNASISIPTSVYSLPLTLAEKVGGWDSDPTSIGEDMHMMLKCYFETAGNLVSRVVYVPASQCNVSSDLPHRGWRRSLDTCVARYRQALRHMWGALDSGFAARRTLSYFRFHPRCLFLRPRHLALLHLLWEAHFLPCHLVILLLFSTVSEQLTPREALHPDMAWAFWFTGLLRAGSFVWMNLCLVLYERWYAVCLQTRKTDMLAAQVADTGFSVRRWWHLPMLLERLVFPVAGMVFGAVPTVHAVFSHFWTDRLEYRVSKKPKFASLV